MKQLPLSLLLLLSSCVCLAQTTQTFDAKQNFDCSLAATRPIQAASQFSCRGIELIDPNGNTIGSYSFNGASHVFALNAPGVAQPSSGSITEVTQFTVTKFGDNGHFDFNFDVVDFNGVDHQGSISARWSDYQRVACGRGGCTTNYGPVIVASNIKLTK